MLRSLLQALIILGVRDERELADCRVIVISSIVDYSCIECCGFTPST